MTAQLNFGTGNSVTFGTTGSGSSSTASFSKSSLTNLAVGDLLIAWIHNQSSATGGTITAPTGWTQYGAADGNPTWNASRLSSFYYYPINSQTDITNLAATPTWTFNISTTRVGCVVARATGIDLSVITDSAATSFSTSSTATLTLSAITTVNAQTLLVGGLQHQNAASTTSPTTTAFMTNFLEYKTAATGSALANSGAAMGYTYLTSAGMTGTINATFDSTTAAGGELVAFKALSQAAAITRPTIEGTSTTFVNSQASTSFSISVPSGYMDGDILVLALSAQTPTATADFTSSGWTRISNAFTASSGGFRLVAFYSYSIPTAASFTTTSFTFTSTDSGSGGRIAAEMFIVRGAELSSVSSGTSPYGSINGQTVTVTPNSINVANNLLLVAYNAQFTSGIDYSVTGPPSGMNQVDYLVATTSASSKTTLGIYWQNVESGTPASKALIYNGALSQGSGVSVAIRGIGDFPSNPGVALQYTSATNTLSTAHLFYTSATNTLSTPKEVRPVPTGYPSVTNMLANPPYYLAHRGGSADWPEMSLYAYSQSVFWGVGALELSLARTSDGVWFGLHDATLDRTSGTTNFTASAHTWAEVQQYQITAAATNMTSQPSQPYMQWSDLMTAYYNTHVIFVDPKVASSYTTELLGMMNAMPGTPTDRFVAKYYGVSSGWPAQAHAAGYKTWGYFYESDASNFAAYQGQWDILGMEYGADQATWTQILSYGKQVIGHIIPNAAAATTAFNFGASGIMVSGVQEAITRKP